MTEQETKELYEDLLAIFSALVAEHFDGIDPFQITLDIETYNLTQGDQEKFAIVIDDFYSFYQIDNPTATGKEYSMFPTVKDVIADLAEKKN